jgi:hypothetical protein
VEWRTDSTFLLAGHSHLRLLQKDLSDILASCDRELRPFFHERVLLQQTDARSRWLTKGSLQNLSVMNNVLTLKCIDGTVPRSFQMRLPAVQLNRLTVWRIDDCLDTLQFNVQGASKGHAIYLQVGFRGLFEAFVSPANTDVNGGSLDEAIAVFTANALGSPVLSPHYT